MAHTAVPSYKKPPVVEVVWSAQFLPLPWLTAAHTGLFWETIRADYPDCEEQPPVERQDESEELLRPAQFQTVFFQKPPLCRQWFISKSGTDLVQLQQDRFCFNWRRVKADDYYPRYDYMRSQFTDRWKQFCGFAKSQSGELPTVDLLEMTYVNHIFKGDGWDVPGEIGKIFPAISFHGKADFLTLPASLSATMVFDVKGTHGRLHVSCRHARLIQEDQRELFRLELVARGRPEKADSEGILEWFAEGRQWIVRGFADLTNIEIQKSIWGREQ